MTDARLAAELARQAGELLLEIRSKSGYQGKELGQHGDVESNALLLRGLAEARPDDAVLSEESADSPARLTADRVWIIDPLDGSREYGLANRDDWAVHVALWERGSGTRSGITAAAVTQPARGAVYTSDDDGHRPAAAGAGRPRFLVSDSRPPAWAAPVAEALGAELAPMGSAGAKAMAVLRGDADAYLHDGGQWEWDSAAPVGVVQAAGLHASRADGSPLLYNQAHPYLPDLVICRAALVPALLSAIAAAR
jgi:3'(2'), 5'-bisphosphate nucleotidase